MLNEPIPVSLAIRAVERAIRECDAARPGPWSADGGVLFTPERVAVWNCDAAFVVVARAGFRALLEYPLLDELAWCRERGVETLKADWKVAAAVAPLIAHYDAVQPGWRAE